MSTCIGVRSEKFGSLEVDGGNKVEGSSPGAMKHLTTDGTVFIGRLLSHLLRQFMPLLYISRISLHF